MLTINLLHGIKPNALLQSIHDNLSVYYKNNIEWSLNYRIGYILFLTSYSKLNPTVQEDFYAELEKCIDHFEEKKSDYSLFGGITGLGWLLQYLNSKKLVHDDDIESLVKLDSLIYESLEVDEMNIKYDLFFGLIGKGLYFLKRPKSDLVTFRS